MRNRAGYNLASLRASIKPFRLYWFPRLRSTNDHAAKLRRSKRLYAPAIVLCGKQTAGRGRGSNTWWSSDGALTVTFVLPIHELTPPQQLPLIAGLAVRQTAVELTGDSQIQLKWPNDVLHDGRKLAGLLCERIDKSDLIGIGLNVNVDPADAPKSLRDKITSLLSIGGRQLDLTAVLSLLAKNLYAAFRLRDHQPFSVFVREFEKHHALVGKTITVLPSGHEPAIVGRCEGIDGEGRLTIRQRGVLHRIVAGNILMNPARSR